MDRNSSDRYFNPMQPLLSPNAFAIALVCMNICFGVAAVAAGYLLLGLFTGHLADFNDVKSIAEKARVLSNLGMAGQVFIWGAALGALFAGAAFLTEEAAGYLLVFAAVLIGFGVPMGFAQFGGANFSLEKNAALRASLGAFPNATLMPCLVGGLLITRDVILRLMAAFQPKERYISETEMRFGSGAKKETAHRPSPVPGKCWEGSYCRETIKVHCPVYVSKTPCWRNKRGCYCDESIVAAAASKINGIHLAMAGSGTTTETSRFNFSKASTDKVGGDVFAPRVSNNLTDAQKRERCRHCVIYNEHQQKKYNLLMPIAIGATVIVWGMLLTTLHGQVDHVFVASLDLLDKLSFTPGSGAVHQARMGATEASPFLAMAAGNRCGDHASR